FSGSTDALINLYALGVFAAFTLSQSGMVRRWLRTREHGWRQGLAINALGAVATGIVTLVIAVAKFGRGAWVVVLLIPALYLLFQSIHHHYGRVNAIVEQMPERGVGGREHGGRRHLVVVPVSSLNRLALRGLLYARSLSPYVVAVHIAVDVGDAEDTQAAWEALIATGQLREGPTAELDDLLPDLEREEEHFLGPIMGPKLIIVDSPYRTVTRPIINFVDALGRGYADDLITVVLPEFVTNYPWEWVLHNQTALRLKLALLRRSHIVTASVPYRFAPAR
nr:hypothetical protein [Ktedonobacterales bacterium]